MNLQERPHSEFYPSIFLPEGAEAIGRFVEAVRARRDRLLHEWHTAYSSRFGAHHAISDDLFQETYGPNLRSAVMSIVRGDTTGFVSFAKVLGEQLANAGVPFAAMVAHLSLWKESCTKALADDPEFLCSVLLLMDQLSCCFISAAADGYYGGTKREPTCAQADVARPEPPPPADGFHGLVGQSPAMRAVFEQIRWIARGTDPVLVVGETGTGKDLVAQAIHQEGPRSSRPFIGVNCAALPRELIESELFGYKRGAFSGAVTDHLGLFRAAAGGTLLLDEITEMSVDLQAKLLRVLQERVVRPVGSVTELPVDVRIIASTNRDPATALACGQLRADLYYRLCGSTVILPPLRERQEDIMLLAEHRMAVLNRRYGRSGSMYRGVTPAAMQTLCARAWPGNVRELFNVLESAFVASPSAHISLGDLVRTPGALASANSAATAGAPVAARQAGDLETFAENERDLIARALGCTGGNKLLAARLLGISRKKLYAKIAKYNLTNGDRVRTAHSAGVDDPLQSAAPRVTQGRS